jgi:hypothetical protein
MILKFKGIYLFEVPMPAEDHKIKASSITDLYLKGIKWFKNMDILL